MKPDMHNTNIKEPEAQSLLAESANSRYWRLANFYTTQYHPCACGIASIVMVLNASGIERPELYDDERRLFTQQNVMDDQRTTDVFSEEYLKDMGIGIREVKQVFENFNFNSTYYPSSELDYESFITVMSSTRDDQFVIVNYARSELDQGDLPHITPVGTLGINDRHTLLFDVSRYYWQQTWVNNQRLWNGVDTTDSSGKYARGVLTIDDPEG